MFVGATPTFGSRVFNMVVGSRTSLSPTSVSAHFENVSTVRCSPGDGQTCSAASCFTYPRSVRLNASTKTRTGSTRRRRSRRLMREAHSCRSRKSAAVVFPLPAAPRMSRNPGFASARIGSCSGLGVILLNVRILWVPKTVAGVEVQVRYGTKDAWCFRAQGPDRRLTRLVGPAEKDLAGHEHLAERDLATARSNPLKVGTADRCYQIRRGQGASGQRS